MRTHRFYGLFIACMTVAAVCTAAAAPSRLHIDGRTIRDAENREVRLRGINWGWWLLSGTSYTENDMRQLASWGANVARLAFDYFILEIPGSPGTWDETGFAKIDDVLAWGKKYGVYVILDMHTAPGGQNTSVYTAGGSNLLWKYPENQVRLHAVWREIARRYRDNTAVAAYEIFNEPKSMTNKETYRDVCAAAVNAIRAVDTSTIIAVPGDNYSGPESITNLLPVSAGNILYTIHFYNPGRLTHQQPAPGIGYPSYSVIADKWLKNHKDGPGIPKTPVWTFVEERITPPADALEMRIQLRSTSNRGSAWFDDIRLADDNGNVVFADGFNNTPSGFTPERAPHSAMSYDASVGHDRAGSLRVQGTTSYNGWAGSAITIRKPSYVLQGWIKQSDDATGDTYLSVSFFSGKKMPIDKEYLRRLLEPVGAFVRANNAPVWVGEFGCAAAARPEGSQTRWVNDCISLFEESGLHWTYWNFKETSGPNSMALQAQRRDGTDYPVNEVLLSSLRSGWERNDRGRR